MTARISGVRETGIGWNGEESCHLTTPDQPGAMSGKQARKRASVVDRRGQLSSGTGDGDCGERRGAGRGATAFERPANEAAEKVAALPGACQTRVDGRMPAVLENRWPESVSFRRWLARRRLHNGEQGRVIAPR